MNDLAQASELLERLATEEGFDGRLATTWLGMPGRAPLIVAVTVSDANGRERRMDRDTVDETMRFLRGRRWREH